VTKGQAFTAVHFTLAVMAAMAIQLGMVAELWPAIIAGLVGNAGTYIGGNVADNALKGRYYQPNLDRGDM